MPRQPETRYLFIDGAYLRKVLEKFSSQFFRGISIPINPAALTAGFRKSFYYDCLPARRDGESDEAFTIRSNDAKVLFESLRAASGVHVFEGTTTGVPGRQRQKQIDVAIAVDMLTHSHRQNMTQATLLTGDLDFKPVVDALVRDGMWVTIWCEPSSSSKELWLSADERIELGIFGVFPITTSEFLDKFPRPQDSTQSTLSNVDLAVRQGYSRKFDMDVYLVETPQRWVAITRSRNGTSHEGRIEHPDRQFLEALMEHTREVNWTT